MDSIASSTSTVANHQPQPPHLSEAGDPAGAPADDFAARLAALRPDLQARALFLAQDAVVAEDLVQDVLERALVARDRFQEGTHLKAWLCSILRNLFIDSRRRLATRQRLELESERERLPEDEHAGPSDVLSAADVAEAMAELDDPQRQVFVLTCVDGLSYHETAARLGIPTSTVGTRLLRTKRRLRGLLSPVFERRLEERQERRREQRQADGGVRWLPCSRAAS
jgi:RNA polymerase sigma-70 factor (ECF subfamily)